MSNETPAEVIAAMRKESENPGFGDETDMGYNSACRYWADRLERSLAAGKVVYQVRCHDPENSEAWFDVKEYAYRRTVERGQDARILYTAPPADPAKASEQNQILLRAAREVLSTELGEMACVESHAPAENALGLLALAVAQYPEGPAKASGSAPDGWRNVLKRAREGLGAGGALGVPGSRQRELEVEIGGMLLDHIEDGLEALTATPPASAPEVTADILRIPAGDKLDAIIVYFEDEAAGKGRMTVACYGDAWTAWWGGMADRTVRQFVAGTDPGYLSGALLQLRAANAMHREYTWRVAARVIAALQQEGKSHG